MADKTISETKRRTWDKEEYAEKAEQLRAEEEEEFKRLTTGKKKSSSHDQPPVQRELLTARDTRINLRTDVGRTGVVTDTTPLAQRGGFFCEVCDCLVKDSMNYLDHINGKKHQRAMGFSMRTERASLSKVQERLKMHKRKQHEVREIRGGWQGVYITIACNVKKFLLIYFSCSCCVGGG